MEKYIADYDDMREHFIHEDTSPSFPELYQQLKRLQGMVRLKKDGRSIDEILPLALAQAQNMTGETARVSVVIPSDHTGGREARYQVDLIREGEALQFEAVSIV